MSDQHLIFVKMAESAKMACEEIEKFDVGETSKLLSALINLLFWSDALSRCSIDADDNDLVIESREELKSIPNDIVFHETFDPLNPTSVTAISLKDALQDIFCSLKGGLEVLEQHPENESSVFWEWQFEYNFHWGRHLIDVVRFFSLVKNLNTASSLTGLALKRATVVEIFQHVLANPSQASTYFKNWPSLVEETEPELSGAWGALEHFCNNTDLRKQDPEYEKILLEQLAGIMVELQKSN